MKIILVTEYFPDSDRGDFSGGVEARCFYLAKELSKKHSILVLSSWKKGQKRSKKIGLINVKRVGPNHQYSNKGDFISRARFALAVYRKLKKQKADVVDAFNFTTYLPSFLGAKKIGAKKIITYHETWIGNWISNKNLVTGIVGEILERITLRLKWNLIIPVSDFTRRKLKDIGVDEKKMVVIYNGVNTADFQKIKAKKDSQFRIVCVSRLIKTKRQETILKALKYLNNKKIKLVLVGDGDDKQYFKKIIEEMKLGEQVELTGFLKTRKEVIKEIKKSHILIHPSAVEGFGIILVESMAAGVPVICSDIAPLKEVTGNGEYGLLFRLGDHKNLAKKILLLKSNKKEYKHLRKKGFERAKYFDWQNIAKKYVEALE